MVANMMVSYFLLQHAADKFISVAKTFHSEAIPFPALRLLGDHEFNDQLLDLERAFLLPPFSTVHYQQGEISLNIYFVCGYL